MSARRGVRDRRVERIASQAEATRELANLLDELGASHERDWYRWAEARGRGEHLHGSRRNNGTTAACPVRGCPILA